MHCRRGEATEEYISDMQPSESNRFNSNAQSIVLQPISNNTHIQKTKYYESEVCAPPNHNNTNISRSVLKIVQIIIKCNPYLLSDPISDK